QSRKEKSLRHCEAKKGHKEQERKEREESAYPRSFRSVACGNVTNVAAALYENALDFNRILKYQGVF
ncbi:MAG: hypothetical protein WA970_08725, partial [Gammaproteobacteria bacterium]